MRRQGGSQKRMKDRMKTKRAGGGGDVIRTSGQETMGKRNNLTLEGDVSVLPKYWKVSARDECAGE